MKLLNFTYVHLFLHGFTSHLLFEAQHQQRELDEEQVYLVENGDAKWMYLERRHCTRWGRRQVQWPQLHALCRFWAEWMGMGTWTQNITSKTGRQELNSNHSNLP